MAQRTKSDHRGLRLEPRGRELKTTFGPDGRTSSCSCSRSAAVRTINNLALRRHGRHRSNVQDYVSQNALALHPIVKPMAMIANASATVPTAAA